VVWFGRSPDRRRKVEVIQARNKVQTVKLDGKQGRPYDGVGVEALVFSPDSRRLAYPALRDRRWRVVLDGEEGEPFGGVGEIVFSPNSKHVAYLASRGGRWHIVRDGRVGPGFHGVFRRTLDYSADSEHLACAVMAAPGKALVVLDGKPGPVFAQVTGMTFGPGGRLAYIGRNEGSARVVVDGKQGPTYDEISEVALGRGGRVAYLARRLRSWVAVVNDVEGVAHHGAAGLTFSADGRHLAYAALEGEAAFVVLDGKAGPRHDGVRVPTLTFTSAGRLLYVARQLDRAGGARYVVVHHGEAGPPFAKVVSVGTAGGRWGYIGRDAEKGSRVVLDSKPGPWLRWASDLTLSPGGKRYAYLARRGKSVAVVVRSTTATKKKEHHLDVVVGGTLVFSPDGQHWGCLAGEREPRRLFMVVDGRTVAAFKREELTAAMMANPGRAEAKLVQRWVAAELALVVGGSKKRK